MLPLAVMNDMIDFFLKIIDLRPRNLIIPCTKIIKNIFFEDTCTII